MNNPLVSILSPCYNVEQFLPKYFETVLGQTYTNLQVVLIDDGSTDDTWKVMYECASKDSRVEIYHQSNQGVSPTRNNLLDKVKGEYVLFVDSDDWIELDMVEHLLWLADKYNAPFVMCDRVINDAKTNNDSISINILDQEEAVCDFLHHDYFVGSLWNKLISTSLIKDITFYSDIWYGEDALFTWNVLQKTDKVVVSNKQLYHYRMNDESISNSSFGYKKLTGHKTWQIISDQVKTLWPQFTELAQGTFARSDLHLLQAASVSRYKKDENIKTLHRNIKTNFRFLYPLISSDKKVLFNSICQLLWYGYGHFYYQLYQLKSKLK